VGVHFLSKENGRKETFPNDSSAARIHLPFIQATRRENGTSCSDFPKIDVHVDFALPSFHASSSHQGLTPSITCLMSHATVRCRQNSRSYFEQGERSDTGPEGVSYRDVANKSGIKATWGKWFDSVHPCTSPLRGPLKRFRFAPANRSGGFCRNKSHSCPGRRTIKISIWTGTKNHP
jgi:hypothetical protein